MKPDDIAAIRPLVPLLAWGRKHGYEHQTFQVEYGPNEHIWSTNNDADLVRLYDGSVTYYRHDVWQVEANVADSDPETVYRVLAVYGIGGAA